jgi:hypothetical protein
MTSNNKKIVFLDLDGVLCTSRSHAAHGTGKTMLEWDRTGVALIKKICKLTGAKIVISSTWRHLIHHKDLFPALKRHGLWDLLYSEPILTEDWRTPNLHEGRGAEIMNWLSKHLQFGEKFVIIDDVNVFSEFPGLEQNLVLTNFDDGILYRDYFNALKILNGE